VLEALAIEAPARLPRFVGALLVAALALVPFVETTAPTQTPCAGVMLSDSRPRATIRTRTHALNPRYMTRRLCARDSAGRIHCVR
jgi:hypothetical protein